MLHHFPSRQLREHLGYVITNAVQKAAEISDVTTPKHVTSQAQTVQLREKLISRVLGSDSAPKTRSQNSSSSDDESDNDQQDMTSSTSDVTRQTTDYTCKSKLFLKLFREKLGGKNDVSN